MWLLASWPVSSLRGVSALSHSMAVEGARCQAQTHTPYGFPQGEFQVSLARDGLLFSHSLCALHPLRRSPSEMVMCVQQSYDGWSLPRHRIGPPVHHTHGGTVQKQPLPPRQGRPQRGTHERFDGAYMTDEHDGRSCMPLGEVLHTGDHARLHSGEGLAARWGTGRIRLPLGGGSPAATPRAKNLGRARPF